MTSQFKRLLKICLALLAMIGGVWAFSGIAQVIARPLVKYVDRCGMPCQWSDKGFNSCQPLKADLEIKSTPEPSGHGQAFWYRATVTNQSCRTIRLDEHFYYLNDARGSDSHSFLSVAGPDGRPVPPALSDEAQTVDFKKPSASLEKSPIRPYAYDPRDVSPAIIVEEIPGIRQKLVSLQLIPGQSLSASYSDLAPTRLKFIDGESKDYSGSGFASVPVAMEHPEKSYAVPPPGYRRLSEFDLRRPGRYVAQFVIHDKQGTYPYEDPVRPYWNGLRRLVHFFARDGFSENYQGPVELDAKSAPIDFEVSR